MLQKLFGKLSNQNYNCEVTKPLSFFLRVGHPIYGDDNAFNVLTLQSTSANNNHSRIDISVNESDNGGIHFYTAGSSVAERRVTIKGTSGKVGIGTNNPEHQLDGASDLVIGNIGEADSGMTFVSATN